MSQEPEPEPRLMSGQRQEPGYYARRENAIRIHREAERLAALDMQRIRGLADLHMQDPQNQPTTNRDALVREIAMLELHKNIKSLEERLAQLGEFAARARMAGLLNAVPGAEVEGRHAVGEEPPPEVPQPPAARGGEQGATGQPTAAPAPGAAAAEGPNDVEWQWIAPGQAHADTQAAARGEAGRLHSGN